MENPVSEAVSGPVAQILEDGNPAPTTAITAISASAASPAPASTKLVHFLVLDANAIIKNEPSVSTLIAQAEELYTIPAVVSESKVSPSRAWAFMILTLEQSATR
jgi:RNA-binding protein NOB1